MRSSFYANLTHTTEAHMCTPAAKTALRDFLLRLPADTRSHLKAVTPEVIGSEYLLHISSDNMLETFSPALTNRTAQSENRSIPRISTATSLFGCILGYQSDESDFHTRPEIFNYRRDRRVSFKGGWIIYGLPFDLALRPDNTLVPDASRTDEHWLVTYDQYTADFKPVRVGKFFYESIVYTASNDRPHITTEIIIEVADNFVLNLNGSFKLKSGYYKITVSDLHRSRTWKDVKIKSIRELAKSDYSLLKGSVASLLSLNEDPPAFASWAS